MTTTTAQYRGLARDAEKAGDWAQAAYCWAAAMEAYPDPRGALAQADLGRMKQRRDAARRQAAAEVQIDPDDFNYVGSRHHY